MTWRLATSDAPFLVAAILPGLVGLYLLAWAWRWPWDDMRNAAAIIVGVTLVLAAATATLILCATRSWGRWAIVAVGLGLVAIGFAVLGVVSDDQEHACGQLSPRCQSLLPGI